MREHGRTAVLALACLIGQVAGCGDPPSAGPTIEVEHARIRTVLGGLDTGSINAAAYMTITNSGDGSDRLVDVRSNLGASAELHRTSVDEAGLATMAPAGTVEIPPGGTVSLEPGGLHVMLIGLGRGLAEGDTVVLSLVFEAVGRREVRAEIRAF